MARFLTIQIAMTAAFLWSLSFPRPALADGVPIRAKVIRDNPLQKASRVRPGMTLTQVNEILGYDFADCFRSGPVLLDYTPITYHAAGVIVCFKNGVVQTVDIIHR